MRVCVRAYVGEPGACVFKTYSLGPYQVSATGREREHTGS